PRVQVRLTPDGPVVAGAPVAGRLDPRAVPPRPAAGGETAPVSNAGPVPEPPPVSESPLPAPAPDIAPPPSPAPSGTVEADDAKPPVPITGSPAGAPQTPADPL